MQIVHLDDAWGEGLDIKELLVYSGTGASNLSVGIAAFPKGIRHPEMGLKPHAEREISLILSGGFSLHTTDGDRPVKTGDLIVLDPGEEHATTALEDSRVLYLLHG